jgi:hypothetical protein
MKKLLEKYENDIHESLHAFSFLIINNVPFNHTVKVCEVNSQAALVLGQEALTFISKP